MSQEKDLKLAQAVHASICEMLDDRKWSYKKDEEKLTISSGATGEDLPMGINISVDAKRNLVVLISPMPFEVPEAQRDAMAVAVSLANNGLVDGSFDYDYLNGRIAFRMTTSYVKSLIGKNLFNYMLECSCYTIDEYNDKFLLVATGKMSLSEILEKIK